MIEFNLDIKYIMIYIMSQDINIKLCVLEINSFGPSEYHKQLFMDNELCDYYYVSYKGQVDDPDHCLQSNTKLFWGGNRNLLYELVPKEYDYYMFVEDDIIFKSKTSLNPVQQILVDLNEYKPAILTPLYCEMDAKYFTNGTKYANVLFTMNCAKIVHKSVLNWMFKLVNDFGSYADCHLFNILEIPFKDYVVTTALVETYNGMSRGHDNKSSGELNHMMDLMYRWLKPSFKKIWGEGNNAIDIKEYYRKHYINYNPVKNSDITNFLEYIDVKEYFDFEHPFFKLHRQNYK